MNHKRKVTALNVRDDRVLVERNGCDSKIYYNCSKESMNRINHIVNKLPWEKVTLVILPNGFIAEDGDVHQ